MREAGKQVDINIQLVTVSQISSQQNWYLWRKENQSANGIFNF